MDKNVKTALIIGGVVVGVLIILSLVSGLVSGWTGYGWGMMGPGMMGGFGWMWLAPVLWIVILGLIIWAVVALVQHSSQSRRDETKTSSALEVLKERYARGEIDKAEYEAKKKDLI